MSDLVQQEQLKRDRHWDARERWRLILEAIAWAEAQSTARRNTPRQCLAEQARKETLGHVAAAVSPFGANHARSAETVRAAAVPQAGGEREE